MASSSKNIARTGGGLVKVLLSAFVLLLLAAAPSWADDCVADWGGVMDGFVAPTTPPAQIQIDGNCTIRNYPASNPLTSNISFYTNPGGNTQRWLVIFDNVVHTGQMSCDAVQGNMIWFTNGSSSGIHQNCQNVLIPVEKIDKANPAGQTTATIGVPFTYTLTIPILYDPATGNVINFTGSPNDLHDITLTDDLNATGADLTYVSHTVYWKNTGVPVPHTFSNAGGVLSFGGFPIVPAGDQFVVEITVVLNNNPAVNIPGTQFVNTAKWEFGRLIDGIFYEPLPGEWGISPPMTIAAPDLIVTKTGPATMNLGQWGDFAVDVHNTGLTDAYDVSLQDVLPDGPTGGMCDLTPDIVSAQVFQANGTTPATGKGPLTAGIDYSLTYRGPPNCKLDLRMVSPSAVIGPDERLIVRYRTQLDSNSQNGVTLTNVAGAIEWSNDASSNPNRVTTTYMLSNGTPGKDDEEDAHTVTVALSGYFFEKTVEDLTTATNPATTAAPGDTLRYTLRFQATDQPFSNISIYDEMDALNAAASFVPGSLTLVSYPAGADISGTNGTGGAKGTGVIDIRNLNVPVSSEIVIQFDITLASGLTNGTVVSDQASARLSAGTVFALSDDPLVNGQADPTVPGDEDPTNVTIQASPVFVIEKTSTDLTADPNVLLAGETLRYTITVKNVGNQDATNVILRDAVPTNTTYVAGSTTLNGASVPDVGGLSPLVSGMLINAPGSPPGSMPANPNSNANNVATITFEVVVSPSVVNGTVISNQGFVSATNFGIIDQPSDDPTTPIPNDPTLNVVGNFPVLFAAKSVKLFVDLGTPGVVDPGDVLQYTITVQNSGTIPATGVVVTDGVPANTTYVADTTFLNGLPVGQPDGGVPPLASGIDISSSNLTPPLPGPGAGTISPKQSAVLQYNLRVDPNTPGGTVISNQAVVGSTELPDLPTDGDGDPSTGPEPTVVVVGDGQQVSITKQVSVVGGGPAVAGGELEYLVRVVNIGSVPALNVVVTDDLDASQPGQLAYVNGSATMNGSTAGVSFSGSTLTADYSSAYGGLDPNGVVVLRFRATLDPNLAVGTTVTNTGVVAWDLPTQTASASVSIVVGAIPGVAALNGAAWHDADFDRVRDSGERVLAGWTVQLYHDGLLVYTGLTDTNGLYSITNVAPNDVNGSQYELRFLAPGAGANTAMLGLADSQFTNGLQRITGIVVSSGANVQGLNMPIQPNGVVYNSISRAPIAGATLTLLNAGSASPLPVGCLDDPAQQGQVTLADGYYKFDVNFSDPACPSGGDYVINVAPPAGSTYVGGYSQIIPPISDPNTAAFSVPGCPGTSDDTIPSTATYCEVQPSEFAPGPSVTARSAGTNYHVHLILDDTQQPGSSEIFNNHIALDAQLTGSVAITKTTPLVNVNRGQLVPYVITVNNISGSLLTDVSIVDRMPAGFNYVEGSAVLDGVPTEPSITKLRLSWTGLTFAGTEIRTVKLLLAVGGGVTEGEYVNRAQVVNGGTGNALSGVARATVRVIPDPTFDCTDVTGKVFNDANRNGVQDDGEEGLPGVRVVTARGLVATTDQYGRYHITCAIVPHEGRGSNFVMKLDDRSLPTGFRMSTDQVQIKRATLGKALKFDFGASVFRVVAIDLSDAAFETDSTEIRVQWKPRMDRLLEELRKAPSILRLSYVADTEDAGLVQKRVDAIKRQVSDAWDASTAYPLTIEPEIFWRRGGPLSGHDARVRDGR